MEVQVPDLWKLSFYSVRQWVFILLRLSWCLLCVLLWCLSGFSSTWTIFGHLHVNSACYQTFHLHSTFLNSFVHTLTFGVVAPIVSAIYSIKHNCTLQLTQMKGDCYTHYLQQDFMQLASITRCTFLVPRQAIAFRDINPELLNRTLTTDNKFSQIHRSLPIKLLEPQTTFFYLPTVKKPCI